MLRLAAIAFFASGFLGFSPANGQEKQVSIVTTLSGPLGADVKTDVALDGAILGSLSIEGFKLRILDDGGDCSRREMLTREVDAESSVVITGPKLNYCNLVTDLTHIEFGFLSRKKQSEDDGSIRIRVGFDPEPLDKFADAIAAVAAESSSTFFQILPECPSPSTVIPPIFAIACFDVRSSDQLVAIMAGREQTVEERVWNSMLLASLQIATELIKKSQSGEVRIDLLSSPISTVLGDFAIRDDQTVAFPLRVMLDEGNAAEAGKDKIFEGIAELICPDCAGSTKICSRDGCPKDCNNTCQQDGDKQCCNKSGMPVPPN